MPSAGPDASLVTRYAADRDALFAAAGIAPGTAVGVALSGGPDSLALLLLAAAAGSVEAMTVDHGLRAEAAAEAEAAGAVAAALGVPHRIVRVTVAPAGEGVQGEARRARYAALHLWARAEGLAAVLTAHHADDQAETLLMRLARGAGLSGLGGIRPVRPIDEGDADGPKLLRPLLGWRKAELEAIVAAAGIEPARDPSNHDARFDRTAARDLLARTPWLDPSRVAASASHLRDAEEALGTLTERFFAQACRMERDHVLLTPGDAPRDILRRALILLFSRHFQASPDGPGLARLMATLHAGGTATLADVMATGGVTWRFRPAPPRRSA
ncbi:tRNA lysidine(34) synthetase TilS [Sphingomonas sp. PR090111-T3T-6A]|uniref:tRNA lysidine(34) synthetase TilS n=1 Tax=Sphingomonas sp. PR090111-T3T-6A TaxID=685778 RepID=UPI000381D24A|nr:tRNA lysidine(34) synthetase TilS [Sphingomonas sp. PR090111-T3T-6A]